MDYQQTCIQKQKHLTNIYFYQNLRQLYIMAPITTVRGPLGFKKKMSFTIKGDDQLYREIKGLRLGRVMFLRNTLIDYAGKLQPLYNTIAGV